MAHLRLENVSKVVPVLFNRAPRHEDVLGNRRYSSTHWMKVNGQLHARLFSSIERDPGTH
jgi:hypothetical protein